MLNLNRGPLIALFLLSTASFNAAGYNVEKEHMSVKQAQAKLPVLKAFSADDKNSSAKDWLQSLTLTEKVLDSFSALMPHHGWTADSMESIIALVKQMFKKLTDVSGDKGTLIAKIVTTKTDDAHMWAKVSPLLHDQNSPVEKDKLTVKEALEQLQRIKDFLVDVKSHLETQGDTLDVNKVTLWSVLESKLTPAEVATVNALTQDQKQHFRNELCESSSESSSTLIATIALGVLLALALIGNGIQLYFLCRPRD